MSFFAILTGEVQAGVSASATHRYRLDDLRRFGAAMGVAVGLTGPRSLALASHLLWFDAAGASSLGIATLPTWLEAMKTGRVDPSATGRVTSERTSLALLDGEKGPAPLVLERAAGIAVEKAREAAVGMVRVVGTGPMASTAAVAAGIAVGPMASAVLGPGRSWSLALPTEGGLPMILDTGLAAAGERRPARPPKLEGFWAASEVLVPEGGWLLIVVSVPALESLAAFDRRLGEVASGLAEAPGRLLPDAWEARRLEVRSRGVAVGASAWKSLVEWAGRLHVETPAAIEGGPAPSLGS